MQVIRGLIHSTLENYGKLDLEGAMNVRIIKAILILPDGEVTSEKVKQPIRRHQKRAGMRFLEFYQQMN